MTAHPAHSRFRTFVDAHSSPAMELHTEPFDGDPDQAVLVASGLWRVLPALNGLPFKHPSIRKTHQVHGIGTYVSQPKSESQPDLRERGIEFFGEDMETPITAVIRQYDWSFWTTSSVGDLRSISDDVVTDLMDSLIAVETMQPSGLIAVTLGDAALSKTLQA